MTFDGRAIANCILDLADASGIQLSNLALQKVVYFCHAWHLAETGAPLVKTEFEAWQHGPVLQYLYRQFKDFENRPIRGRATSMNPHNGKQELVTYDLDAETLERLKRVVGFYGSMEPWDLVDMSHEKGGPWYEVWNHSGKINPGMKISHTSIQEFFSRTAKREQLQ
jgi:uncharacterized phage-associated protein